MHVTLEYIVAAGMIFVMLAVTTATTMSLNHVYAAHKEEFQLVELAESVADTLLLHPGYPRQWGADVSINSTDTSGLTYFGLSVANQTIYRLDADKVSKLCNGSVSDPYDNRYYVPPDTARDLLGLGRNYGFKLSILPIFKVAASTSLGNPVLHLSVSTQDGVEVPNANVTVIAFWSHKGKEKFGGANLTAITDWGGQTELDFSGMGDNGLDPDFSNFTFLIATNLNGLRGFTTVSNQDVLHATIVGDRFLVQFTGNDSDVKIKDGPIMYTYPYTFNQYVKLKGKFSEGAKNFTEYQLEQVDPYCNAVLLFVKQEQEYIVVVAERPPQCIYQTQVALPPHTSTVVRLVEINGFDYFARFTLWRMSE